MKNKILITCIVLILALVLLAVSACSSTTASSPPSSVLTSSSVPTSSQPSTTPSASTSIPVPAATTSSTLPNSTTVVTTSQPATGTPASSTTSTPSANSSFKINLNWNETASLASPTYLNFSKPYQDEITKETGGRVTFTVYPSETLVKQQDEYDGVIKDIIDIAYAPHSASPGLFPAFNVFNLPLLAPGTVQDSDAMINKEYNDFTDMQAEHADVHILDMLGAFPYEISTSKKPVNALQDLKGLRIGGPSAPTALPSSLGAVPVEVNAGDLYSALDKGVIDGVVLPLGVLTTQGLVPLLHYYTMCNLASDSQWFAMNQQVWNKLPPDIQQVFNTVKATTYWPNGAQAGLLKTLAQIKQNGYQIINLSSAEMSKWDTAVQDDWNQWVKTAQASGVTQAQAILNETIQLVHQYNAQEAASTTSTTTTP